MKIVFRLLILTIVLLVVSPLSFSQVAEDHNDEKSLYSVALFAGLKEMDKRWSKFSHADYHHMIVQKNAVITNKLPVQQGDFYVEYLTDGEILARRQERETDLATARIFPMSNTENSLEIHISVEYVEIKEGRLMYGISDWSNVTFRYDCYNKKFVVSDVKLGGI